LAFSAALAPAVLHNRLADGDFFGVSSAGGENAYLAFGPDANGFYAIPPFVGPYAYLEHQDLRDEAFLRTGQPHSRAASSRFWLGETWRVVRERPAATARLIVRKFAILFADFEVPDSENFAATRPSSAAARTMPSFGWIVRARPPWPALRRAPHRHLLLLGFAAAPSRCLLAFNLGRYRAASALAPLAGRGGVALGGAHQPRGLTHTGSAARLPWQA
jgi:hypothetical protein